MLHLSLHLKLFVRKLLLLAKESHSDVLVQAVELLLELLDILWLVDRRIDQRDVVLN